MFFTLPVTTDLMVFLYSVLNLLLLTATRGLSSECQLAKILARNKIE